MWCAFGRGEYGWPKISRVGEIASNNPSWCGCARCRFSPRETTRRRSIVLGDVLPATLGSGGFGCHAGLFGHLCDLWFKFLSVTLVTATSVFFAWFESSVHQS